MARAARPRQVEIYVQENGNKPYLEWLMSLRDNKTINRIIRRIDRIGLGNFGDHKSIGEGVQELRIFFGPGYRVYFAEDGDTVVVLLCGGDKDSQVKDIKNAITYWKDYLERK